VNIKLLLSFNICKKSLSSNVAEFFKLNRNHPRFRNTILIFLTPQCNNRKLFLANGFIITITIFKRMNEAFQNSGNRGTNSNENTFIEVTMTIIFTTILIFSALVLLGR
jgi:hypothetical protein